MHTPHFFEDLPEGYECKDITDQFTYKHFEWRKATKKQRRKFKGLYGIAYNGEHPKGSTGLLRFIAKCLFYKKKGFITVSEDSLHKTMEYVVV